MIEVAEGVFLVAVLLVALWLVFVAVATSAGVGVMLVIPSLAILAVLGIESVLVKPYRIPSESMEPTLEVGQRVLVNRVRYEVSDPDRGDVVVFHPPRGATNGTCGAQHADNQLCRRPDGSKDEVNLIKRIVALPGDTLSVRDGRAVVNGKLQDEPDIRPCAPGTCNFPEPITIPPGHFFMMGDNRGASDDSRFWGPVPEKWIIGQAFATYWPPKRVGIL